MNRRDWLRASTLALAGLLLPAACASDTSERGERGERAEPLGDPGQDLQPERALAAEQDPAAAAGQLSGERPELVVYKDPNCGCCDAWVEHVHARGYRTRLFDTSQLPEVKANLGVPRDLSSCHTTVVGRYVVEGHVPAEVIDKLLTERPQIAGIAVPGMPIGSPGMEVEGMAAQRYDVIAYDAAGRRSVFARR